MNILMVCGSRNEFDKNSVFSILRDEIKNNKYDCIIQGGCSNSPDIFASMFGEENGLVVGEFQANWNKFGKKAGIVRNELMVKLATKVILFWDEKSRGTKSVLDFCRKYSKPYIICTTKKEIREYAPC
jgi:hypothetical protein